MLRAIAILRKGNFDPESAADSVTLDHAARQRRRIVSRTDSGTDFLIDLDKAPLLRDGDALQLEDGGLLLIKAAAEKLLEIRATEPAQLIRIAWHIGNRHTPAELTGAALYIVEDHVLGAMVEGLGGRVYPVLRPFQPEAGAYAIHAHGQ